ncbi:MAG: lytic transglycosylase domain-containing protein [Lentisphaeria bacterium]|nr:lytic transglycosylase domain-containing protein [Lentisphaeria bacterium]
MMFSVRKGPVKRKKSTGLFLLLLISVFAVCSAMFIWRIGESVVDYYTRFTRYDEIIRKAGLRNGVDPYLLKAVIWRESKFDRNARGLKGEVGLMQIMPGLSAKDWARIKGFPQPSKGALYDPELNIEIGSWYLGRAVRRWQKYKDVYALALGEYNAGARRVNDWKPVSPDDPVINRITIPSTRSYVQDILAKYKEYREQAHKKKKDGR